MDRYVKVLAVSLLACTGQVSLAAGSPGVERHAQGADSRESCVRSQV
jgi:hypothetical protein